MKQRKAITIQERFGFLDDDLKKPNHDEIMKWTDKNIGFILSEILEPKINWLITKEITNKINSIPSLISELKEKIKSKNVNFTGSVWKEKNLKELFLWNDLGQKPDKPNVNVQKIIWEHAITSGKFVIGFIDLYVIASIPYLTVDGVTEVEKNYKLEPNIIPKWKVVWWEKEFAFEIKTEISSLGELIRQISLYKNYLPSLNFVVISPDDTHIEILKSQKIGFYKYEPRKFVKTG